MALKKWEEGGGGEAEEGGEGVSPTGGEGEKGQGAEGVGCRASKGGETQLVVDRVGPDVDVQVDRARVGKLGWGGCGGRSSRQGKKKGIGMGMSEDNLWRRGAKSGRDPPTPTPSFASPICCSSTLSCDPCVPPRPRGREMRGKPDERGRQSEKERRRRKHAASLRRTPPSPSPPPPPHPPFSWPPLFRRPTPSSSPLPFPSQIQPR